MNSLTPAEKDAISKRILDQYKLDEDFAESDPEHLRAALAFIQLLDKTLGEGETGYVHIVPADHVSEGHEAGTVAVIYEEISSYAEQIMGMGEDGPEEGMEGLFDNAGKKFQAIEKKHGVYFEMMNSWASAVYSA